LLRIAPLRRLLTVNWLLASCWDVHAFMVPLLGHDRGLSASSIGMILGAFALAGTAMRLTLPWVVHRLPEMRVVGAAMLLTAMWFALYPFAEQAWHMMLLSSLLGMTLGAVQPLIMSTLHQVTPRQRQGEALGLRMMTIYASSVVMPMVYGSAGTLLGVGVVFWAMGSVVAAGSRLAFNLERGPNRQA
jgi:MFS family permease